MMNNKYNHHPKSCSFAEEIVSYIYGETEMREKLVFENHLASCANCADEIAELSNVSFSINAWRDSEFSQLQTPNIIIPYQTAQKNKIVESVSGSWLSGFRQIFSSSSAWMTASAAMAVLVLCVGLIFVAVKFSGNAEVAGIDNSNLVKPAISPTAEINSKQTPENVADNLPKQSEDSPKPELVKDSKISIKKPNNVLKVSDTPKGKVIRQNAATITPNTQNSPVKDKNNVKPAQNRKSPTLNNFEEDEDDSLRLADLFAEIETK